MYDLRYKFTIQRLYRGQISLGVILFLVLKKCTLRKKFLKHYFQFSFKIGSITLGPDPNWAKILDPDPNSIYLDYTASNCTCKYLIC